MKWRASRRQLRASTRIAANSDLLVHLSVVMFLRRLAEESRTKSFEERSSNIKPEHVDAVARDVLKRSKG